MKERVKNIEKVKENRNINIEVIQEKLKSQKAITLVSLVVTIVILIILATVSINVLLGEGGLINQAKLAKDMTTNSSIAEQEQLNELMGWTTNSIEGGNDGGSEIEPPVIEGVITINPAEWQGDGTASVIINSDKTEYIIEYRVDKAEGNDVEWTEIENGGTISDLKHGDAVFARLTDGNNYGDEASVNILDGTAPTVNFSTTKTHESISITVTATDGESGLADNNIYTYTINGESSVTKNTNTHTFSGLTASTSYTIKVEVGNKQETVTTEPKPKSEVQIAIENGTKYTNTTPIKDDLDNIVYIPGGFHLAEESSTKVEGGIVIEDDSGNQFVWIPTGEYKVTNEVNSDGTKDGKMTNALSRRTFTSSGATTVSGDTGILDDSSNSYYGEGDSRSVASGQIVAFKTSATNHGGFYIGRYEQGSGNVCKKGVTPYVNITRDKAKSKSESMYSENSSIKATTQLISSYAWDTALNFICQTNTAGYTLATTTSSSYGNIGTGTNVSYRKNTGEDTNDKYSNIHDLLGNCYEWTTEYCKVSIYTCVLRGGRFYDYTGYASFRSYDGIPSGSADYVSFRLQLYM